MNTTETTHNFINRLNEQQQLEREIFEFVKSIKIKNATLDKFRSNFINLYANYTFYVPNRNNYLKLFVSIINYLQSAELGDNIKNIPGLMMIITQLILTNPMNSILLTKVLVMNLLESLL